ncbi:MAG: hypothetical protein ACFFDF_19055 [Candidatus Odinarchaeota archaeon]
MPRIKNNEYVNKNSLKEFINKDKEEITKYEKLSPEKKQKLLDLHCKREVEKIERIENGYYCEDCTGPICYFYETCKRKNVGNPQ